MNSHGLDHRAADVAKLYASFAHGFVLDERDGVEAPEIERLGMNVVLDDTLAKPSDRAGVARSVVQFSTKLRASSPAGLVQRQRRTTSSS